MILPSPTQQAVAALVQWWEDVDLHDAVSPEPYDVAELFAGASLHELQQIVVHDASEWRRAAAAAALGCIGNESVLASLQQVRYDPSQVARDYAHWAMWRLDQWVGVYSFWDWLLRGLRKYQQVYDSQPRQKRMF